MGTDRVLIQNPNSQTTGRWVTYGLRTKTTEYLCLFFFNNEHQKNRMCPTVDIAANCPKGITQNRVKISAP